MFGFFLGCTILAAPVLMVDIWLAEKRINDKLDVLNAVMAVMAENDDLLDGGSECDCEGCDTVHL